MVNKRHILLFLWTTVSARILALVLQLYVRNKLKLKLKCSAPNKRTEYCDGRVCLCVCVCVFVCPRSYLRTYTSDLRQFFANVT